MPKRYYTREELELMTTYQLRDICMQVLGLNTVMNVEEVVRYVEMKTEEKLEQITNFKLYRKLFSILQEEQSKTKIVKKKVMRQRKIIVD